MYVPHIIAYAAHMACTQKRKRAAPPHSTSAPAADMVARKVHPAPLARSYCRYCTRRARTAERGLPPRTDAMPRAAHAPRRALSARSKGTCSLSRILVPVLLCTVVYSVADAHGFLEEPHQRGTIEKNPFTSTTPALKNVPESATDYKCHFPAGDKKDKPGSAINSQIQAAGPGGWTPYEPTNPGFVFRSGPCGDLKGTQEDHMRGGKYYYPPEAPHIVAEYEQGGILSATVTIIGHHNGFFEFTLCDVSQCGGEISEDCLRNSRACQKLLREPQPECETGTNMMCAPIDRNYPTRYYVPCRQHEWKDTYGKGLMKYRLPTNMFCEHCVLQWYWCVIVFVLLRFAITDWFA